MDGREKPRARGLGLRQLIVGFAFMGTGSAHFWMERFFTAIVPKSLPNPKALVYVSGVAEFLGGAGVLIPRTRRLAGKGLIALLVAVFPANINMAVNAQRFSRFPAWSLWARLPLQWLAIRAVHRATQSA